MKRFELRRDLPEVLETGIVFVFVGKNVAVIRDAEVYRPTVVSTVNEEDWTTTVQRDVFGTTGILVRSVRVMGVIKSDSKNIPVFVALAYETDRAKAGCSIVTLNEAGKRLAMDGVEQQLLHVLLYYAFKTFTEMDKEKNRKLVMRTVAL